MADGGKGSQRRPGQLPEGAWERIFNKEPAMIDTDDEPPRKETFGQKVERLNEMLNGPTLCECKGAGCRICCPTDDGPGQEMADDAGGAPCS